jgi:serine/threonine protein kinase
MVAIPMRLSERRYGKGRMPHITCEVRGDNIDFEFLPGDHKEQREVKDDYDMLEVIGQGGIGSVYRAVCKNNGQAVALKVVRVFDEEKALHARKEFFLLQKIDHPNIVQSTDFFFDGNQAVLAMPLLLGNSLDAAVRRHPDKRFPEVTSHKLFVKLLSALDYLHRLRIVHRDIKPANVMIEYDLSNLQLIDFNIAQNLSEGEALSPTCTPAYAAPEVMKGQPPSESSDIWGAGLCLLMMLSGHCEWASAKAREKALRRLDLLQISEACIGVLKQCLVAEYTMRPAAMLILQTEWAQHGPPHQAPE